MTTNLEVGACDWMTAALATHAMMTSEAPPPTDEHVLRLAGSSVFLPAPWHPLRAGEPS